MFIVYVFIVPICSRHIYNKTSWMTTQNIYYHQNTESFTLGASNKIYFISDIVFVSVLNLQHYDITKLMLENGKHVLCEKPMGMNYNQTKSLVDLAREKKLFLLEGMWSRFFPAYDALEQHISSGGLGDIYHISIQFGVEINEIERNL